MSFYKNSGANTQSLKDMEEILALKEEQIKLLQAQKEVLADKSNFHDDVLTEMILAIMS